jgi:hypothetical protein
MNHEILYHLATVCASVGSANNINKLSLVGMQLPGNIRRNSTFRARVLRLELLNSY